MIFVSHCLLNENTRYLGGAFRKAGINELIDELQKQDIGIVQMKCPEQQAWGGVLKTKILRGYGIKKSFLNYFRKVYSLFFIWRTKQIYKRLALQVASEVEDYLNSDFQVVGIIGVNGSPSCGVTASLDINKSADYLAGIDINQIDSHKLNEQLYGKYLVGCEGLYIRALKKALQSKRLQVKILEHNLLSEINKQ